MSDVRLVLYSMLGWYCVGCQVGAILDVRLVPYWTVGWCYIVC